MFIINKHNFNNKIIIIYIMTTTYGTLSLSELNVYNNNNTTTPGNIIYDNINEKIIMNTGLVLDGNLNILNSANGIRFGDNTIQFTATDVTTIGDNTFIGENTFDTNAVTCNAGLKVSGDININNNLIFSNNNNTGTISYANNTGVGNSGLTNFVFNLPTTTPNLSSEGGLLVNDYFTGSINFTDFNLSSISWKLKVNTSGLINIVIKNKTSKISYSAFYNMFNIEISETEILTTLSNISNSGNTIDDCGCSFDVSNTNGEFTLQDTSTTSTYDIQLYFTGVNFEITPHW